MIVELTKLNQVEENTWYEYSLQSSNGLESIMLIKQNGSFRGFKNYCPHQGRRLDYAAGQFLLTGEGNIVCPAHGAEFDAKSGLCTNGPCLGQSLQSVPIEANEESVFTVIK